MGRFFGSMGVVVVCWGASGLLLAAAASAQITLVPGPSHFVGYAPERIAAADFNRDGVLDAAVTHAAVGLVSILRGRGDGSFDARSTFRVTREVDGLVVRDLNGDGNVDIAVAARFDRQLFVLLGHGDGTFSSPRRYPAGRAPIDLAVGSFVAPDRTDIAVADAAGKAVQVFANVDGKAFFRSIGEYRLDGAPTRILAADFDGDGVDDLAVLTADGTGGTGNVDILLNRGAGHFGPPTSYVVEGGATDMVSADTNGDGAPDLLVLSAVQRSFNHFPVSILLNQSRRPNPRGPSFTFARTVEVVCPARIDSYLVACTPRGIVASDLNADGINDFAVSFETVGEAGAPTTGLLIVFQGVGNGEFDFNQYLALPEAVDSAGLVAADFTGDAVPDLGVTQPGSRSARILTNIPPYALTPTPTPTPRRRQNGSGCTATADCDSLQCVDGVCCDAAVCGSGQRCDIYVSRGRCAAPQPTGGVCKHHTDCGSGYCAPGFFNQCAPPPTPTPRPPQVHRS